MGQMMYAHLYDALPKHYERAGVYIEDVLCDTYLRVRRLLWQYDHRARLSTWLFTVGLRVYLSAVYRERRRRSALAASTPLRRQQWQRGEDRWQESVVDVEETVLALLFTQQVRRAMSHLPAYQRAVFTALAAGQSYDEISRQEGLPVGTVKSRVARARAFLQGYLGREV
jgi:RNA polymerase sigma-70 factor (ECF subfamily)